MRTISQPLCRFIAISSRSTSISLVLSLFLNFSLWSLEHGGKVNAAPAVLIAANSGFLYVLNDCSGCPNEISGFAVDETTGALTPLTNGFPAPTGGNGKGDSRGELLTIDRNNLRLFAINDGSNTVSAFSINPATGALSGISGPIGPISGLWVTSAVHPSCLDSLLVIGEPGTGGVNTGRLASFKITATGGAMVSVKTTGSAHPFTVAFSQDGRFVYTGGASGSTTFAGLSISASGTLEALNGVTFNAGQIDPVAYATDAKGRLFMATRTFHELKAFRTVDGMPTLVQTLIEPTGSQLGEPGQGVLVANDKFYVVSDRQAASNLLGSYQITGPDSNPTLTPVLPLFHSGGTGINLLTVNRDGTLLFALNSSTRNVSTFRIDANTGSLGILQTQPLNTLGNFSIGMAYLPPSSGQNKIPTTTTINAPSIIFGQDGQVRITVSSDVPSGTIPTGDISLSIDGEPPELQPLLPDASATFVRKGLTVGNHSLVANFIPTADCFLASSKTETLTVNAAETTLTITAPPIRLGQDGVVTVSVQSQFATPSGNVSLRFDGGAPLTKALSSGSAAFTSSATFIIRTPSLGKHSLRADFSAQGGFKSRVTSAKLVVGPPLKTVTKISTPSVTLHFPSFGQTAPVTVTVTTGQFPFQNASGKVSLQVGNRAKVTKALSGGEAIFNVLVPKAGIQFLRATFLLQDGFAASRATKLLMVRPAPPPETQP